MTSDNVRGILGFFIEGGLKEESSEQGDPLVSEMKELIVCSLRGWYSDESD